MTPDGRADLVEWIHYLREIGVRELRVSGPASDPVIERTPVDELPRPDIPSSPRAAPAAPALLSPGFDDPPPADRAAALEAIREDLGECTRCKLHRGRNKIVFGVGDPQARLMFVGEGPGADEDAKGEPFVGRAGKKLDEMIVAIGLERSQVYIANIVKCRPPNNRDPERDEIETCSPFLTRQIEAIRPRAIVTLGAPAARTLLGTRTGITRLRGQWHEYRGIPVMPTFHPAYLLRAYTRENRKKVWEDLKAARARIEGDDPSGA